MYILIEFVTHSLIHDIIKEGDHAVARAKKDSKNPAGVGGVAAKGGAPAKLAKVEILKS